MTHRWQDDAACASDEHAPDLNVWWGETTTDVYRAKRICATCPVLTSCRIDGLVEVATRDPELDPGDIGIWGGLTGRELADAEGEPATSVQRLMRDKAMGMLVATATAMETARALGIPVSTVQGWLKEATRQKEAAA